VNPPFVLQGPCCCARTQSRSVCSQGSSSQPVCIASCPMCVLCESAGDSPQQEGTILGVVLVFLGCNSMNIAERPVQRGGYLHGGHVHTVWSVSTCLCRLRRVCLENTNGDILSPDSIQSGFPSFSHLGQSNIQHYFKTQRKTAHPSRLCEGMPGSGAYAGCGWGSGWASLPP